MSFKTAFAKIITYMGKNDPSAYLFYPPESEPDAVSAAEAEVRPDSDTTL